MDYKLVKELREIDRELAYEWRLRNSLKVATAKGVVVVLPAVILFLGIYYLALN